MTTENTAFLKMAIQNKDMRIAVVGAGAIGGLVAGYLKLKGHEVQLVGRAGAVSAIKEKGLRISGVRGDFDLKLDILEKLESTPELAILAVKTQDLEAALVDNIAYLNDALVITAQNGVRADDIACRLLPKENVISSIVMFGATSLEPGEVVHNFEGNWIIGRVSGNNDNRVFSASEVLNSAFPAVVTEGIRGMKYLKVFVNANNCIPALLGISMQEAFSDIRISRIAVEVWREGFEVISKAGLELLSLPDFPLERLKGMVSKPAEEAAGIYTGIMLNLSKEPLYGSILQSIRRGKPSEIDYINGEFVRIAGENQLQAPLNEKLVTLVHGVEKGSGFLKKEELLERVKEFLG